MRRMGGTGTDGTDGLAERYRDGDTEERIRVLGELNTAAAMGAFAGRHLPDHDWRHGVVKLVFMGVPLSVVAGLDERTDAELARMAEDLAEEREAAGRTVPDDLRSLLPATDEPRQEGR